MAGISTTVNESGLTSAFVQAVCSACLGIGRPDDRASWKETHKSRHYNKVDPGKSLDGYRNVLIILREL